MLYKNQIHEMNENELTHLAMSKSIELEDSEYVDPDEIIELIEDREGTIFESPEDDILDSIYNGNWSYAVEQMHDMNIYPDGLIDYIEDYRFEVNPDAYDWFTLEHAVNITQLYYQLQRIAA